VTTLAGARGAPQPDVPATMVVFFDVESAKVAPEAKSIVLAAVDAAERGGVRSIELAAHSSPDELAHDPELAARRAAVVKDLIAELGFRGQVYIDHEAPQIPLAAMGDETFQRSAILRVGG
jgi:outer membrane protein OmpA-like peptidoglycan-associated protein